MKQKFLYSRWGVVSAITASALLTACWGDGDDDNPQPAVTSAVPDSASQSTTGFIAYLQALVVASADGLEPVDTNAVTAPTDDTTEPVAIN